MSPPMRAKAATPPTAPPTIAPMLVELLVLPLGSGLTGAVVPEVCDDVMVEAGDSDEVDEVVDVVLVSESRTSRGWSIMEMIVGSGKHRYMDFGGAPGQRKVPHAPHSESVLEVRYLCQFRTQLWRKITRLSW